MIEEALDADFQAILKCRAPAHLHLPEGLFESPEVLKMLRDLARTIRPNFAPASWMILEEGELVGLCSLVKAPTEGAIDIGYGVTRARRGRGYAAGAVADLLTWARGNQQVLLCRAETSVDNIASQRVLQRNGFERVGNRTDEEDGDLMCWAIEVSS